MKKTMVVVRRQIIHRVGFAGGCILTLFLAVGLVPFAGWPVGVLMAMPVFGILGPMTLYYLTWQIRFEKTEIVRRVCFRKTRSYPYSMLRNATKAFYHSERDGVVHMDFADGRTLRFRMRDENALHGLVELKRHSTIKTL